jgi:predicted glycoside hydrolase/deacetylase ChbG (UPF0249 family)
VSFIITADDFGMSSAINVAIARSLTLGYASHTSALVNGAAAEEASALARQGGFADRVGLHFNLTTGRPLTDEIRRSPRFCAGGHFTTQTRARMVMPLSADERRAVARELRAQIERARQYGFAVAHLDGHNHCHISPNLAALIAGVARSEGIRRLRLARNSIDGGGLPGRAYKAAFNLWLRWRGLTELRHFGTVEEIVQLSARGRLAGPAEVMIHPIISENGTLSDAAAHLTLEEYLAPLAVCRVKRPA